MGTLISNVIGILSYYSSVPASGDTYSQSVMFVTVES